MRSYQDFNLFPTCYPDNFNKSSAMLMATDLGLGAESLAVLQGLGLNTAFTTQISHPVTPTGLDSHALGESCMRNNQDLNNSLPALCPDTSSTQSVMREKSDSGMGLGPLEGLQALGLSTAVTTPASHPGTPTGSESDSPGGCNTHSYSSNATSETHRKVRLGQR